MSFSPASAFGGSAFLTRLGLCLLILLAVYVVLTVGFLYAWRKYDRKTAGQMTGGAVKSA